LADAFEAGLDAWDVVMASGGGSVDVDSAAALEGAQGLAVTVVDSNGQVHVRKHLAPYASTLSAEFLFDPNSLAMAEGSGHPIFLGDSISTSGLSITLQRWSGAYHLRLRVVQDDGQTVTTRLVPITDEPHTLHLEYSRATAPGVTDGHAQLWIDGVAEPELTGLSNSSVALTSLRLGAVWQLDPGTAGTSYFDNFRAW
ncbi:MAG: hypothetical protein KDD47_26915, partial [Acidobacteria bacterium]|nr:hypothetical protein [Acidobacteriota bacterium]